MPIATKENRRQARAGRFYDIPELGLVPSVTTILQAIGKPALVQWAANVERELVLDTSGDLYLSCELIPAHMSKMAWITTLKDRLGKAKAHQKELSKAAEIGTQAHALIEWKLKAGMLMEAGPSPYVTDKATWAFMAWQDWAKSVSLKPLLIEQVVYSPHHKYAGTLDLFAEVNGVPTVIDWKTGKAVYSEAHLQNAAYRHALREMGHGDAKAGLIVRLPKVETDPEFEVVEALPEQNSFDIFLNTFALWRWMQDMEAQTLLAAVSKLIVAFQEKGITEKMLESYMGHQLLEWDWNEIAKMRPIYVDIADGKTKWADYVQAKK